MPHFATFIIKFFQFHIIACSNRFDSHVWTLKSDIIRASYEDFDFLTRSCVCVPHSWEKISFSFVSLALSLKIRNFQFHIRACSVTVDSHARTQKSDITRASYELFDFLMQTCVFIPHLWHKFSFSFMHYAQLSKSRFLDSIL